METNEPVVDAAKSRKVLIVDDHPLVRQGLARMIDGEKDLVVCGEAEDAAPALQAIAAAQPDIVIVDISLKSSNGLDLVKEIGARHPHMAVLVLSMHDETLYAERALRAGAKGYLMKEARPDAVIAAIRKVLEGDIALSERMSGRLLEKLVGWKSSEKLSPLEALSDRELEIFRLVGQGLGTRQIAEQLFLSIKTVETHYTHIKAKLSLKNAIELRQAAFSWAQKK